MREKETASVLVADDNAIVRQFLSAALRQAGYLVELARDGLEAIEMFMAGEFDLVITDIRMPRMDGCMVAQYVRTSEKKVPVIGMSSDPLGLTENFDMLLEKPFNLKVLMESIDEAFETARAL